MIVKSQQRPDKLPCWRKLAETIALRHNAYLKIFFYYPDMFSGSGNKEHTRNPGSEYSVIVHRSQLAQVQSNSLRLSQGHTRRQTCTNSQGIQGDHSQVKNLRANLTFLVKILSDFTELPIAKQNKKSFLSYVFSLTVSVLVCLCGSARVCMCVCICSRACMGIRVIRKGERVQWVID